MTFHRLFLTPGALFPISVTLLWGLCSLTSHRLIPQVPRQILVHPKRERRTEYVANYPGFWPCQSWILFMHYYFLNSFHHQTPMLLCLCPSLAAAADFPNDFCLCWLPLAADCCFSCQTLEQFYSQHISFLPGTTVHVLLALSQV